MGRVIDIEKQRVEQLALELVPTLRDRQQVSRKIADVDDVDRWRRAARRAGRILGVRVRTGVNDHRIVWVVEERSPLSDD